MADDDGGKVIVTLIRQLPLVVACIDASLHELSTLFNLNGFLLRMWIRLNGPRQLGLFIPHFSAQCKNPSC